MAPHAKTLLLQEISEQWDGTINWGDKAKYVKKIQTKTKGLGG